MKQESLLIGAGNSREKRVHFEGKPEWAGKLTTLDMNPNCDADVVWDLSVRPLPFDAGRFDEIGAFDVLEHTGTQGDWAGWFDEMGEYHRLLKPGGHLFAIVPIGKDWYADPGHGRFINLNWFLFLSQSWYDQCLRDGMPVTDYRWYWTKDFEVTYAEQQGDHHLAVILIRR